jgi:hypothetical protein
MSRPVSTADAWIDDKYPTPRAREPMGVVISQIILALGMGLALCVIAMAVIWSSSPSSTRGARAPGYRASWRPSHHFRAVVRADIAPKAQMTAEAATDAIVGKQQPPSA